MRSYKIFRYQRTAICTSTSVMKVIPMCSLTTCRSFIQEGLYWKKHIITHLDSLWLVFHPRLSTSAHRQTNPSSIVETNYNLTSSMMQADWTHTMPFTECMTRKSVDFFSQMN